MFFKGKNRKRCEGCGSKVEKKFSFCPGCGNSLIDSRSENLDYGLLGKSDEQSFDDEGVLSSGVTDKLLNSVFNSLMKNFDKQFGSHFRNLEREDGGAEIRSFPNGIRIKIAGPFYQKKQKKRENIDGRVIDESQIRKMSSLPRVKGKTRVKRIGNKVIYEINAPGVLSAEDVFVSRLESGYEIKVIGGKKVYVNNIPINLPILKYSIADDKLLVEFHAGEEF